MHTGVTLCSDLAVYRLSPTTNKVLSLIKDFLKSNVPNTNLEFCYSLISHQPNPLVTNGLSHPSQLGETTFIFRGIKSVFSFR